MNYACYQDARFIIVGTPSGVSLAPEGGAHQSIYTPLIGMGQPGLTAFEPAFVDELAEMLRWSFEHLQDEDGGSVYLRLSTRAVAQPQRDDDAGAQGRYARGRVLAGSSSRTMRRWRLSRAARWCRKQSTRTRQLVEDIPGAGLMIVTSPDRLEADWRASIALGRASHIERLLRDVPVEAASSRSSTRILRRCRGWARVGRHRMIPLGVDRFGQSGDIPDLYHAYGIDADAIVTAAARLIAPQI